MAGYGHSHALPVGSKLKFGILLSAIILAAELIGGFASNSLALLSDAGHVFTDMVALTLSWYAVRQAQRPPSHKMTFGSFHDLHSSRSRFHFFICRCSGFGNLLCCLFVILVLRLSLVQWPTR